MEGKLIETKQGQINEKRKCREECTKEREKTDLFNIYSTGILNSTACCFSAETIHLLNPGNVIDHSFNIYNSLNSFKGEKCQHFANMKVCCHCTSSVLAVNSWF